MAEYIEREAAYRFAQDQLKKETGAYTKGWNNAMNVMKSALHSNDAIPAADVVPVVRCKDCRKGIPDSEHATAYSCYGIWHKPDWFCAGGVRKTGDGDV